jgi:hypothetical protein
MRAIITRWRAAAAPRPRGSPVFNRGTVKKALFPALAVPQLGEEE